MDYLKFIFGILAAEAVTNILTKSELFHPVRAFFFEHRKNRIFNFIHDVLDCGYCTSVWIGALTALYLLVDIKLLDFVVLVFVIHRLSNITHMIIDRIDRTRDLSLFEREGED